MILFYPGTPEDELLNSLVRLDLLKKTESGFGAMHYFKLTNLGERLLATCASETYNK